MVCYFAPGIVVLPHAKLHGSLEIVQSGGRLQQRLMSLWRGTFEEIQQESPFSRDAQCNMLTLLRGWEGDGERGFTRAWDKVFPTAWEAARKPQHPIQIISESGDCEDRALEVRGAPDRRSRVFAEFWYLSYTFGSDWTPAGHSTRVGKENGSHFSVHDIRISRAIAN